MAVSWHKRVGGAILRIGVDRNDSNGAALQKAMLVGVSSVIIAVGVIGGLTYLAIGATAGGSMPLLYSALSAASTGLFGLVRRLALYRFTQLTLILLVPWMMMVCLGGFH